MKLEVKLFVSTRDAATLDSKYFVLAVGNVSRVSLFCKRVEKDCQLSNGFALNFTAAFWSGLPQQGECPKNYGTGTCVIPKTGGCLTDVDCDRELQKCCSSGCNKVCTQGMCIMYGCNKVCTQGIMSQYTL